MPVLHVGVNLEPFGSAGTDAFISTYGLEIVGDDYTSTSQWVVRNRFFSESGQPLFAAIAMVADSPTHQVGELLLRHAGYGQTDFTARIAGWRTEMDSVRPPPERPVLAEALHVEEGSVSITLLGEPGSVWEIQVTADFVRWEVVGTVVMTSDTVLFTDDSPLPGQGFYRAVSAD